MNLEAVHVSEFVLEETEVDLALLAVEREVFELEVLPKRDRV